MIHETMVESMESDSELTQANNTLLQHSNQSLHSFEACETLDTELDEEKQKYIEVSCGTLTGRPALSS